MGPLPPFLLFLLFRRTSSTMGRISQRTKLPLPSSLPPSTRYVPVDDVTLSGQIWSGIMNN